MKPPTFQFPPDRITHLSAPPEMADFEIFRAIAVPSTTPGVHFVAIINDAAKIWRFARGPSAVPSRQIWRWLAAVNPHWLKAGWAFQETDNPRAPNPDAVLDRFSNTGTEKRPTP